MFLFHIAKKTGRQGCCRLRYRIPLPSDAMRSFCRSWVTGHEWVSTCRATVREECAVEHNRQAKAARICQSLLKHFGGPLAFLGGAR